MANVVLGHESSSPAHAPCPEGPNADNPALSRSEAPELLARAQALGLSLRYGCTLANLAPPLRDRFVQLGVDRSLAAYFDRARRQRHGHILTWIHRLLRGLLSDFDINGLLGTYPMHVLGTEQWAALLPETGGRLLDVGAGNGDVTCALAPLFDDVTVVETSRFMARRLARRGYRCHSIDLSREAIPGAPYDTISLLNVLDRCDRPLSLLGNLRSALKPGGQLVIALVLPYRPFVYAGAQTREPIERLSLGNSGWEQSTSELVENVLGPLDLEVEACSRAPYLSGGDVYRALYELDDVVLVCRARSAVTLLGS